MRCATASVRTWSMWGSAWRRLRSWQVMTAWRRRGGTANRPSRISNKWWSSSVRKSRNSPSAYPSRMLWPLLHESLCNPLLGRGTFGEMVETRNLHHDTKPEPRDDPSYANQDPVDNDIGVPRHAAFRL